LSRHSSGVTAAAIYSVPRFFEWWWHPPTDYINKSPVWVVGTPLVVMVAL